MKNLLFIILCFFSFNSLGQGFLTFLSHKSKKASLVVASQQQQQSSTFITSGDYYIRSDASGGGNGTDSLINAWTPAEFETNEASLVSGDTVLFSHDQSFEVTFNNIASGVVVSAYGSGDKPKMYGSEVVTGFTQHSGNIYKASITASNINQVFVDGVAQKSARYPNSGYFKMTTINSGTQFVSTDLDGGTGYSGATAIIRTREWWISTKYVTGSSSQTITINSAPTYDLDINEGFVLFDKLAFLDQAGEWYFDDTNDELYLWVAAGDDPDNYTIRASTTNDLVSLDSKSNIVFQDLQFLHANDEAFYLNNCDHITVDNCDILYSASTGINVTNSASNNITISNCLIDQAPSFGINMLGDSHTITDNTIQNIGLFDDIGVAGFQGMEGTGLYTKATTAGSTVVRYNKFLNIGYNGMLFEGKNNIIEYNYFNGICSTIDDGGAIYGAGAMDASEGAVVQYNIIENVVGTNEGFPKSLKQATGIYIDDNAQSNLDIRYNTVNGAVLYGVYLHNTSYINVYDNIIFNVLAGYRVTPDYDAKENEVYNNIIVNTSSGFAGNMAYMNPNDVGIVAIDNNTYVDHHRSTPFRRMDTYAYISFSDWKTVMGEDVNSTFDSSTLPAGDYEKLLYNNTKAAIDTTIAGTWNDLDGNPVTFPITLQPFTSKILTGQ